MLSGWMLYCVLVAGLMSLAALSLEQAARRLRFAHRWVWGGALGGSVLLPLGAILRPPSKEEIGDGLPALVGEMTALSPTFQPGGNGSRWEGILAFLPSLDPVLLGAWGGMSCLLLAAALAAVVRVHRARRGWEEVRVRGRRVLLSEATGPAVVGLIRGAIVLPRWALAGDPRMSHLMIAHEEQHLRARDPLLLASAAMLVLLLPWNLPLWWQLRRLKLAVEIDCDARVLGRGSDLREYATLLLEVGRRRSSRGVALVSLAEPDSFLERRIRVMTAHRGRRGWLVAMGSTALAALVVTGACTMERPAEPKEQEPAITGPRAPLDADRARERTAAADTLSAGQIGTAADPAAAPGAENRPDGAAAAAVAPGEGDLRARTGAASPEPGFSPRDTEPSLRNVREVTRALADAYPAALREAGISGRAVLWVRVDERGQVAETRVYESSGNESIDAAAMQGIRQARFHPAELDGQPVPVWIALPVQMSPPGEENSRPERTASLPPRVEPVPRETREQHATRLAEPPGFSPRDVEPQLDNPSAVAAALDGAYPAAMKDAGVGGRVLLWIFVDRTGRVGKVQLYESSGYPALDEAAMSVMRDVTEFTPARNRGEVVPVWVALPVTFSRDR